ncbi:MAG: TonB-dependent receptor [Gemmatimonadales bacterium]|nr:MAG: TonB-dependent receptor [Gemmatimonadales bacterium]
MQGCGGLWHANVPSYVARLFPWGTLPVPCPLLHPGGAMSYTGTRPVREGNGGGRRHRFGVLALCSALLLSLGLLAPPLAGGVEAQTGTLTGTVVNTSGQPIANAFVTIQATNRSGTTNARGQYTFQNVATGSQEIRVTSLGYRSVTQTATIQAGQTATLDFTLSVSAVALDEVVVTGQAAGIARREIGTSIASVDVTALESAPINNLSQLLAARAPGVNVMPGGGKSGQGSRIVLRGAASISQSNEPLIYVDGIRIDNSSSSGIETTTAGASWSGLDDINPADIERIEIIRGASAATLYGTEASAGVIQIFTRRGREGITQWRYNADYGVLSTPLDWWDISAYSAWFHDEMVQRGATQSHQVSVTGGGQNFSYYAALTGRTEDGILPNGGEDAYSARLNLSVVPRQDVTLRLSSGFTRRSVQHTPDANNTRGYTINGLVGGPAGQFGTPTRDHTVIEAFQNGNRFTGGLTAEHQPTQALSHRLTFGADIFNSDEFQLFPFGAINNFIAGYRSNYRRQNLNLNVDYAATLRGQLTDGIRSTTSAGFQYFNRDQGWSSSIGNGFPFIGLETVSAALSTSGAEGRLKERSAGFFAEQQFGFGDALFVTLGARADGHSAFGEDVDYAIYPKADVSYVLSDQVSLPTVFSSLRVRASYGTAGQQPSNFSAVRTWLPESAVGGQPAVRPGNLGNPDLTAEISTEIEFGIDMGLLEDRMRLEVTRFDQRTTDALYAVREPPSLGFLSTQLRNVGEIENKGWEVGLRGTVIEARSFGWDATINYSTNENRIVSLGGGAPIQLQWLQFMREGYPVGSFFGDRFIELDGEVGLASNLLRGSDGELPEGWDYLGQPLPTRQVQFGSSFSIGPRVGFSFLLDHKGGHMNHDHSMRWLVQAQRQVLADATTGATRQGVERDRQGNLIEGQVGSTTAGPIAHYCRDAQPGTVEAARCGRNSALTHGDFAFASDFIKLREVTLTYRMPDEWLGRFGVQSTTLSLAGRNLLRWTDYPGLDPEGMYRNDLADSALRAHNFFDTPTPRQIVFGVSAQF